MRDSSSTAEVLSLPKDDALTQKAYDSPGPSAFSDRCTVCDAVVECGSQLCDGVTCLNGAKCKPTSPDDVICMCPLGTVGDRCQTSK